MGLFDSFKKEQKLENEQEAAAVLFLLSIAADGELVQEEYTAVVHIASSRRIFKSVKIADVFKKAGEIFSNAKGNSDMLLDAAAPLISASSRLGIFTSCIDIIFSDGSVDSNEKLLAEKLKAKLGISDTDAQAVVQVISWKNTF